jgi:diguanylate cyclase (GGDEF)-like protein
MVGAGLLSVLYLYRGRAFIVYWILSWILTSGSLFLGSRGYADVRLGSVMLGLAQLLDVWSAGLIVLAADAYPDAPLRWNVPVRVAAVTAVWFLTAPLLLPLVIVLVSGALATGVLLAWGGMRYLRLSRRRRYFGAALIGAGMLVLAGASFGTSAMGLELARGAEASNRVLALNVITSIFIVLGMHLLVFEDMTDELRLANRDLAAANEEVNRLAITDPLTGCHNRRFFDEIERHEMQRHHRYGTPLAVVFIDVNRFKKLNDTFGHEMGDAILRTIGAMLRRQVRQTDYVIRWGGDEFLLVMNCTSAQAERKAGEIKVAFERDPDTSGLPGGVTLSIGIATVGYDAKHLSDAIRIADERMYQDKFSARKRATM